MNLRLYQATRGGVCAGWVETERGGYVMSIAPILRTYGCGPGLADRLTRAGFSVTAVSPR